MIIKIKNMKTTVRKDPWDVRVDRRSVLGNPYHCYANKDKDKEDKDRAAVCVQYKEAFDGFIERQEPKVMAELGRLYKIYMHHEKINLFCWCAPKQCHSETIRTYLLARAKAEIAKKISETQLEIVEYMESDAHDGSFGMDLELGDTKGYLNDLLNQMRVIVEQEEK